MIAKSNLNVVGTLLYCAAVVFTITTTIYFGCNVLPQSTGEIVCDTISLVLAATGLFLVFKHRKTKT